MRRFNQVVAQAFALVLMAGVAQAQTYTMWDLDPNGTYDATFAYGISQTGHIAGVGYNATTGELHALVFANGTIQDLGMFGYPYGGDAVAINDNGQVLGTGYGPGFHALIWQNGQITHLGSSQGASSEGAAINSLGHVVGRVQGDEGGFVPFSNLNGTWAQMQAPIVQALAINDSDQIVGSTAVYWTYGGYVHSALHGFLLSGGVITDLGNVGGGPHTDTVATSINNAGQIVGWSTAPDATIHAFRYSGGVLQDLTTLAPYYAYPTSINDSGLIVGNLTTWVGGQIDGFLCIDGVMSALTANLDASGAAWSGMTISSLNDNGWITGSGTINGAAHAFVAKPIAGVVASIGTGCGGAGMPVFGSTAPRIGQNLNFTLAQGTPNASGFLYYSGVPAASIALGSGCVAELDLSTAMPLIPVTANATGAWASAFPVPLELNLVGVSVALQIALFGTGGPLGLDISNGLIATIGY